MRLGTKEEREKARKAERQEMLAFLNGGLFDAANTPYLDEYFDADIPNINGLLYKLHEALLAPNDDVAEQILGLENDTDLDKSLSDAALDRGDRLDWALTHLLNIARLADTIMIGRNALGMGKDDFQNEYALMGYLNNAWDGTSFAG